MSSTFYGNMVNLLNAQFQFDREYSNYKELQDNTTVDGVYIGRHSLVRYEKEPNNLDTFIDILEAVNQVDPKDYFEANAGLIAYLLQYNITLYNLTPNFSSTITIPICKYDTTISCSSDMIIATIGGNGNTKIYITAAEGIDFADYKIYFNANNNQILCYDENEEDTTKREKILLENIIINSTTMANNRNLNLTYCQRAVIYSVWPDSNAYYLGYNYSKGANIETQKTVKEKLTVLMGLDKIEKSNFVFKNVNLGKIYKVNEANNCLICDNNYNYYFPLETIIPYNIEKETQEDWWTGYIGEDYYTSSDLQFYNLDDKDKNYKLNKFYKRADNIIYNSAITSSEYQEDFKYYLEIPFAHFKVVDSSDSFEINKLIDNYYFGTDNLVDFENELDYDLTVWKKQFINSIESYKEVTGFKLPNMNYNLVKNGVLAVDEDNKIKGKELRGLGKLGVTYQDDTIDISHERSRLNTRILGDFDTAIGEVRTLSFPTPEVETQFGYDYNKEPELLKTTVDYYDHYPTTVTSAAHKPNIVAGEDVYWGITYEESQDTQGNTVYNVKTLKPYIPDDDYDTVNEYEIEKGIFIMAVQVEGTAEEAGSFLLYKINSEGEYDVNSDGTYNLYKNNGFKEVEVEGNTIKWPIVYYDADLATESTYFKIPSFTIDEYGHIDSDNNVTCRLPALEGDRFTVEFSNLDANYAKSAGVAYSIAPSVNFKIGKTTRHSKSYLTTGMDKDKTYTWTLEDLGLEIGEGEQDETRYPVASNLKNVTNVTIGNITKTVTLGKDDLSFTLNEIGAIPLSENTSDSDLLINGTQATIAAKDGNWEGNSEGVIFNEAVSANKSFKIGDVFKVTPSGTEATFNKIILTEESYGIDLPTNPTEGQLFFKLEDASLEGGE